MEYILVKFGKGKLVVRPKEKNDADYLYWLHFANGTLQLSVTRNMFMRMAQLPADNQIMGAVVSRREHAVGPINDRLKDNERLAERSCCCGYHDGRKLDDQAVHAVQLGIVFEMWLHT